MTEKYFLQLHFNLVGTLNTHENRRCIFCCNARGYPLFENKVVNDDGYVKYLLSFSTEILEDLLEEL